MPNSRFTRLGGILALIGGTLWVVAFGLVQAVSPHLTGVLVAPVALLLVGLLALQARHAIGRGLLGVLGFTLTLVGLLMVAYGSVGRLVMTGDILGFAYGPVGFSGIAPGAVVLGGGAAITALSVILANVMPRLSPIPLLIGGAGVAAAGGMALWRQLLEGAAVDVFPLQLGPLAATWAMFGLGWLWLGYLLWSEGKKVRTVPN